MSVVGCGTSPVFTILYTADLDSVAARTEAAERMHEHLPLRQGFDCPSALPKRTALAVPRGKDGTAEKTATEYRNGYTAARNHCTAQVSFLGGKRVLVRVRQ